MAFKLDLLLDSLSTWLPEERLSHSFRVAETAVAIGQFWKESAENLLLAGLLHDIAKGFKEDDSVSLGIKQNRLCHAIYRDYFPIWHAFIAPHIIQNVFGIQNRKILSGVRWHTTGRARMSIFEQIIYIADYVEPGRKVPNQDRITQLACQDIDQATFEVITNSIRHIKSKNAKVHPFSIQCQSYYHSIKG